MVLDILCRAALLALCCVTTSTSAQSTPATELKIATFNIRGADINESPDPPVDLAADEEYPWAWRGPPLIESVLDAQPDVIGFQEVRAHQLSDLVAGLAGYDYVARETGSDNLVSNPVFWNRGKLSLANATYFWLSTTPDVQSMGWDATQFRIVTLTHLKILATGEIVTIANTHLDSRGSIAKVNSASLLNERIGALAEDTTPTPLVILLGDLNSPRTTEAYAILTGGRYRSADAVPGTFVDTRRLAGDEGNRYTYQGFMYNSTTGINDYVLAAEASMSSGGWSVTSSEVLKDTVRNRGVRLRISDHRLVQVALAKQGSPMF